MEGAGRSPPRLLSWHVTLAAKLPSLGLSLPLLKRDCAHPLTKRGVPPGPHSPLCSGGGGAPQGGSKGTPSTSVSRWGRVGPGAALPW